MFRRCPMKAVKNNLVLLVAVSVLLAGCGRENSLESAVKTEHAGNPVKILVVEPSQSDRYADCQKRALELSRDLFPACSNAETQLIFATEGKQSQDVIEGGVSGIIMLCAWDDLPSEYEGFVVGLSGFGDHGRSADRIWTVGSTVAERVRAVARYMVDEMQLADIAVILDENDDAAIRQATIFSAEVVRLGGVVSRIYYVKQGEVVDESLKLKKAFFAPLTDKISLETVKRMRSQGVSAPVFVVQRPDTEGCGQVFGRVPEDIYVVGGVVNSDSSEGRTGRFIEHAGKDPELKRPECLYAADAYWLLADALSGNQSGDYFSGRLTLDEGKRLQRSVAVAKLKLQKLKVIADLEIH